MVDVIREGVSWGYYVMWELCEVFEYEGVDVFRSKIRFCMNDVELILFLR